MKRSLPPSASSASLKPSRSQLLRYSAAPCSGELLAADRPGAAGVGLDRHLLLDRQPLFLRAQDRRRLRGMLGRHVVGHGAQRFLGAQRQHLGTERRHHHRRLLARGQILVNALEIGAHGRQRLVVAMAAQALDHRNVADAQAQDEALLIQIVQRNHGPPRGKGITRIDIGDRAADGEFVLFDSR